MDGRIRISVKKSKMIKENLFKLMVKIEKKIFTLPEEDGIDNMY